MVVPPNHPKLEPFSIEPYGDFGDVSPKDPPHTTNHHGIYWDRGISWNIQCGAPGR